MPTFLCLGRCLALDRRGLWDIELRIVVWLLSYGSVNCKLLEVELDI